MILMKKILKKIQAKKKSGEENADGKNENFSTYIKKW